jgi:hypothetical protein
MKKDLIFAPIMLLVGVALFLFQVTGTAAHIAISVVGLLVLAAYTAATKKEWKIPALEIVMRVCYGIALVTGPMVMKLENIAVLKIAHKAGAALFVALLVILFVYKLIASKKAKN